MESTLREQLVRLPKAEKLQVIAFLAQSLVEGEAKPDEFPVYTPVGCEEAAIVLQKHLELDKSSK